MDSAATESAGDTPGRLEAIWVKRVRRGPMDPVARAVLDERGLAGSANRGGRRAVTLIERATFEKLRATLGPALDPAMRRANLMVSGVRLAGTRGRVLTIGRTRIRIGGETRPCERMDEAHRGLRAGYHDNPTYRLPPQRNWCLALCRELDVLPRPEEPPDARVNGLRCAAEPSARLEDYLRCSNNVPG